MNFKTFTIICALLFIVNLFQPTNARRVERDVFESKQPQITLSRHKRGSSDFLGKIKNSITAGIGKASASSAGVASGSSSSKHIVPIPEKEIHFDGWELKKSILNTLFQAVKAITGGITAINGQLIKGSGYALSHGGKLVAASGDAITSVGKKIALSAKLLPPEPKPYFTNKFFGSSGHGSSGHGEDFTSFAHDDLLEFAQPHDLPAFAPEPPIPYLPVDVAYDNHFPAPHIAHEHYGPPPHITNYLDRKVQELIKHPPPLVEEHHETIPLEGPETTDTELGTQVANQKAVEALTFLLQKLPNKFALHSDEENSVHAEINDEILQDYKVTTPPTVFKQHSIPSDPVHIPQFKPIKPAITSTYTFQLGPIESVTGPDSKLILPHPIPHHQHIPHYDLVPPPVPITSSHNTNENAQYSYKIHSDAIESPPLNPLDLYHTMTIKNNNNNAPNTLLYVPPSPNQQPLFEIQKSIQYQLQH